MSMIRNLFRYALALGMGGAVWLGLVSLAQARSFSQTAAEGELIYKQKCAACHSIGGGRMVGPDLQGVTARRSQEWLTRWLSEPDKMLAEKEPIATQLLKEYNNMPMPNLGLKTTEVVSLLAYLENPASAGDLPAAPTPRSTGGDPGRGQGYFTGARQLANRGTNCIACHSVVGISTIGGGTLGPDLTHVFQRLGAPGLSNALVTLPFPTMQGVFANRPLTPEEQADLYVFFEQADQQKQAQSTSTIPWFWGAGLLGALALFGVMAIYWPRQRQSLSDRLRKRG